MVKKLITLRGAIILILPPVMPVRPRWVVMNKTKVFHGIDLPNAVH